MSDRLYAKISNYLTAFSSFLPRCFGVTVAEVAGVHMPWGRVLPASFATACWTGCLIPGTGRVFPHLMFTKPQYEPSFSLGRYLSNSRLCRHYAPTSTCRTTSSTSSQDCLLIAHTWLPPAGPYPRQRAPDSRICCSSLGGCIANRQSQLGPCDSIVLVGSHHFSSPTV